MTEYEKMISGAMYNSSDKALVDRRLLARKYCRLFNTEDLDATFNEPSENQVAPTGKDAGNCFRH